MTTPRYLPVDTFKQWWKSEIDADDELIEAAINAAETALDQALGRRMIVAGSTASDRSYRPDGCSRFLFIHDATEVTTVTENGNTLTVGTDFILEPLNGLNAAGETVPYDQLTRVNSWWYTNGDLATVTVTAKWGWAAIPAEIIEACKIVTADLLANRDVQLGVIGIAETGAVSPRQNPTVREVIRHYRTVKAAGGIAG